MCHCLSQDWWRGKDTSLDLLIDLVLTASPPLVPTCWKVGADITLSFVEMNDVADFDSFILQTHIFLMCFFWSQVKIFANNEWFLMIATDPYFEQFIISEIMLKAAEVSYTVKVASKVQSSNGPQSRKVGVFVFGSETNFLHFSLSTLWTPHRSIIEKGPSIIIKLC